MTRLQVPSWRVVLAVMPLLLGAACPVVSPQPAPASDVPDVAPPAPADTTPAPAPPPEVRCDRDDPHGPVRVSADALTSLRGRDVTDVTAQSTSRQAPVEVCGIAGQTRFLLGLTCADGTPAFKHAGEVYDGRIGAPGMGGRCDNMVDLFRAWCDRKAYDVYLDIYFCGPDEDFDADLAP